MFKNLKNAWRRWKLDRDFRRKGIVGKVRKVEDSAIAAAADKSRLLGIFLLFLLFLLVLIILVAKLNYLDIGYLSNHLLV